MANNLPELFLVDLNDSESGETYTISVTSGDIKRLETDICILRISYEFVNRTSSSILTMDHLSIGPLNSRVDWKCIQIDGTQYLISVRVMSDVWDIFLTNLIEIWTETITKDVALERCETLNLMLDLEEFDVKGTLDQMLKDIPSYVTTNTINEIKLQNDIEGVAFKFQINLHKGTPRQLWDEVTKPLCKSSMELCRRHDILSDLIKAKDEEIIDLKLNGAQLIRKNIETLPYDEQIFVKNVPDCISFDALHTFQSMMGLYNRTNVHGIGLSNDLTNSCELPCQERKSTANIKVENETVEPVQIIVCNGTGEKGDNLQYSRRPSDDQANSFNHEIEFKKIKTEFVEFSDNSQMKSTTGENETCIEENPRLHDAEADTETIVQASGTTIIKTELSKSLQYSSKKMKRNANKKPNIYDFIS